MRKLKKSSILQLYLFVSEELITYNVTLVIRNIVWVTRATHVSTL